MTDSAPLPDRRLHAYRPDLADASLEGQVAAARFVTGRPATVIAPVANIYRAPDASRGMDTQLLRGDVVDVFDTISGFGWCKSRRDGYVGHVPLDALALDQETIPTHMVCVPRSFVYPEADMKLPPVGCLSMGSRLRVVDGTDIRGTRYAILDDGTAFIQRHLRRIGADDRDPVSVAESLVGTPYLWGGASAFGIDCSGLVQLSHFMCGRSVLRDSDMQADSVGTALPFSAMDGGLKRGDLVFWKGHVGMMADPATLLHANGHTMTVAQEPLEDAVERIGYLYGFPTGLRRPD